MNPPKVLNIGSVSINAALAYRASFLLNGRLYSNDPSVDNDRVDISSSDGIQGTLRAYPEFRGLLGVPSGDNIHGSLFDLTRGLESSLEEIVALASQHNPTQSYQTIQQR